MNSSSPIQTEPTQVAELTNDETERPQEGEHQCMCEFCVPGPLQSISEELAYSQFIRLSQARSN